LSYPDSSASLDFSLRSLGKLGTFSFRLLRRSLRRQPTVFSLTVAFAPCSSFPCMFSEKGKGNSEVAFNATSAIGKTYGFPLEEEEMTETEIFIQSMKMEVGVHFRQVAGVRFELTTSRLCLLL